MYLVGGDREKSDAEVLSESADSLLAICDFSYQHYALGDILTTQVDLAVMAIERGLEHVDIAAAVNPKLPSAAMQSYVTSENYVTHLDGIVPAFMCNPLLRSLHLIRDMDTINHLALSRHQSGKPMWPELSNHVRMRQNYPLGHANINAFHVRHGYLPQLWPPRGYDGWARGFHAKELGGRPLLVINPRQASLTSSPAALFRDAKLETWYAFVDEAALRWPKFLFLMVGGFQEWE